MSAFISFEKSNVHWGLSRWKQLKHDKNALVGFHVITENKSDTFKQTIRFSYMCAKLSLARSFWEKWSTCLPVPQYKSPNPKGILNQNLFRSRLSIPSTQMGLLLTVTDISITCAVVIFRVKVSCITSVDGTNLWLLTSVSSSPCSWSPVS